MNDSLDVMERLMDSMGIRYRRWGGGDEPFYEIEIVTPSGFTRECTLVVGDDATPARLAHEVALLADGYDPYDDARYLAGYDPQFNPGYDRGERDKILRECLWVEGALHQLSNRLRHALSVGGLV